MATSFEFDAESRSGVGTVAARAIRRAGRIPGILYGGHEEPVMFSLAKTDVIKSLANEGVYSHVLTLKIDGKAERSILKAVQRHPSKSTVLHMDFQRVSKTEKIRVHVPLHFIGESKAVGVKKGGVVTHNIVDLEVNCLPDNIPEFIEVDLSQIDLGQSVHLSEITVPSGVEIYGFTPGGDQDLVVASIQSGRIADSVEPESEEEQESEVDENE